MSCGGMYTREDLLRGLCRTENLLKDVQMENLLVDVRRESM